MKPTVALTLAPFALAPFALAALAVAACLIPLAARAAEINLATLSCDKYENEMVGSPDGSAALPHPPSVRIPSIPSCGCSAIRSARRASM